MIKSPGELVIPRRANSSSPSGGVRRWPFWVLVSLASISLVGYVAIGILSRQFELATPGRDRPLLAVLLIFGLLFAVYLLGVWCAVRGRADRRVVPGILAAAMLFRVVMLPSQPIQEVDVYRYIWDGMVTCQGISPFRFSPEQVLAARSPQDDTELARLVQLRDRDPTAAEVLRRIHFGHLPTIYPSISQAVFAIAARSIPHGAPLAWRVTTMKFWLLLFDLGTIALILLLLPRAKLPRGLVLVYAWCPLVMKEVANSGHLDSIAVFLTVLAVYLTVRWFFGAAATSGRTRQWNVVGRAAIVALVLAAGVGAKLYPVILAPLLTITVWRRQGWRSAFSFGAVFAIATTVLVWPMMPGRNSVPAAGLEQGVDPSAGLSTFLHHWEMNDFLFLIVIENLRPDEYLTPETRPWFVAVPDGVRRAVTGWSAARWNRSPTEIPFLLTRLVTGLAFLLVAGGLAWRAGPELPTERWLEAVFLTIAWFWLLCPTQNPWYWMWALPFLPFARNRAWLLIAGLLFLYYLRFWFYYHRALVAVAGTGYRGTDFFDLVVTWFEFAPWFGLLLVTWIARRFSATAGSLGGRHG